MYAEDPRTHLLLGKLAIRLNDRQLLREAHQLLIYFGFHEADRDLHAASGDNACILTIRSGCSQPEPGSDPHSITHKTGARESIASGACNPA